MKDKNLPDYNHSKSIEELTQEVNMIIEELENKGDIKNSLEKYQKLVKLNSIIEKKFQKKFKNISQKVKENIQNMKLKKNVRRPK